MVPTQDIAHYATRITSSFPSPDYLPAGVVAIVILAFAIALVCSVRRRDAD